MILSDAQLEDLTRRRRRSAQRRVLDELRVPYRLRPDGSIVVFTRDISAQQVEVSGAPVSVPRVKVAALRSVR